jgi:hypothetical protein
MSRHGSQSSRLFFLVSIGACAVMAWSCALVASVDFDAAKLGEQADDGGDVVFPDGSVPAAPDGSCPSGMKACNGVCVSSADPKYGCNASDCAPCSLANATENSCGGGGVCIPQVCAAGFDDCDFDPANGCETDLRTPATCGACTTKCESGMFCAPAGCVSDCPVGLTPCNGACIDTLVSVAHCGGCGLACAGGANADPLCAAGACALACRPGFADCTNTPAKSCTPLPKWYQDGDGDGYGTTAFVEACAKPAGYAPASGDCLDGNGAVHPNAPPSGTPFNGPNGPSFDYDCNGVELEPDNPAHFAGCDIDCIESGYIVSATARTGVGVNDFCGSTRLRTCNVDHREICRPMLSNVAPPIRCN